MSRRNKGRKRRGPSFYTSLVALSGAAALFLGSFLYLAFLSGKPSQPPFEESSSPLGRQITGIDRVIYTCLYEAKVPQKSVLFLEVKPRHRDRVEWDFTELLVRVPRQESVSALEKKLKTRLSSRGSTVRFQAERGSHGEAVVHIFSGAYDTHRIRIQPRLRTATKSAKHEIPASAESGRARRPGPGNGAAVDFGADAPDPMHRGTMPRVAIIIDDLGYDLDLAKSFVGLDLALTLSVLPMAPYTEQIIETAGKKKCEVMVHLPMEPESYPRVDAGPGALLTKMNDDELNKLLEGHLKRVPGARGVNNHMGSRFTESADKMQVLLNQLKSRSLFYVDSRTTTKTVALEVARKLGVAAAERNVFLDNDLTQEAMAFQLRRLLAISRQTGKAIAIAHPHPETVTFMRQSLPLLKREARVVHVSEIME
jgi:polysaccharide deacetylase 2 family uncharacterized protein YibQ